MRCRTRTGSWYHRRLQLRQPRGMRAYFTQDVATRNVVTTNIWYLGPIVAREAIDPENLVVLDLGGGEELAFDKTTVRDPPGMIFSNDIPRLFREWNTSHPSNALLINGRGVPVRCWPDIYKDKEGIKKGAWERIKAVWCHWKVGYHLMPSNQTLTLPHLVYCGREGEIRK